MTSSETSALRGKIVVVTGGLGFIGSALVRALVAAGAHVRVLDSLLPQHGGSPRNLNGLMDRVEVTIEDVRAREVVSRVVRNCDVVFHLAGPSAVASPSTDWTSDIDISCLGTLHVLDALRVHAPEARFVFASSAAVYGRREAAAPVIEQSRLSPRTLYGVHKLTGEAYARLYRDQHSLACTVARIATPFGPRQRLRGSMAGTFAAMLDAAIHDDTLRIPALDTAALDLVAVDHLADMLVRLCVDKAPLPETVNLGAGTSRLLSEVAASIVTACGTGRVKRVEHMKDPGSAPLDVSLARSLDLLAPSKSFEILLQETVEWYRGSTRAT